DLVLSSRSASFQPSRTSFAAFSRSRSAFFAAFSVLLTMSWAVRPASRAAESFSFSLRAQPPKAMMAINKTARIRIQPPKLYLQLSGQNGFHDTAVHVRQPEIAALITIREPGMVDAQAMQQRGVEVVHMHWRLDDVVAIIVGRAVAHPAFDSSSGYPHRKTARMVIATV